MPHILIWIISAFAIAGVIRRPFKIAEAIWAVAGALVLVAFGLFSFQDGIAGVLRGTDVSLFLTGMMLLAETAAKKDSSTGLQCMLPTWQKHLL